MLWNSEFLLKNQRITRLWPAKNRDHSGWAPGLSSPKTSAVNACKSMPCIHASGGSPAFRQVCDRKVSRSQFHSTGTCGNSRPRRPPLVTIKPCSPVTTSSGRIGYRGRQNADFDRQLGRLVRCNWLKTWIFKRRRLRRLGHRPIQRVLRDDISNAAAQPSLQMQV